jgi:hypothetical protein
MKKDEPEGCWQWVGAKTGSGYGHGRGVRLFPKGEQLAHRQSFFLHHGRVPTLPLMVLHKCNNPLCVRPEHLYEGDGIQNVADAIRARGGIHWAKRNKSAALDQS